MGYERLTRWLAVECAVDCCAAAPCLLVASLLKLLWRIMKLRVLVMFVSRRNGLTREQRDSC